MAHRTQYTPGTFSWIDLTTPDQAAAKTFYGELLGWSFEDAPIGDGVYYSMALVDGRSVAAIAPQPQPQRDAGAPPLWNSYITVESADAAVERATSLGGSAHAPAFDVMDAGRMAVLQDPHGAYFMVWEPRDNPGAGLVNAPGALTWNELTTPDLDASEDFYGDLFGWTTEIAPGPMEYRVIQSAAGLGNGGMRPPMPPETPPFWLVYLGTAEITASTARVTELGGKVLAAPMVIEGMGEIAVAADPLGAVFALYAGNFAD
jgi:predicted enzyme related to lactoylglutathione lyase